MTDAALLQYIAETFADIQVVTADGNSFIYYAPDNEIPERTFPFATLVTKDDYDTVSNLSRPGVFRLNIGVSKATFLSLLGSVPPSPGESGAGQMNHDFTVLDKLLPHPIYGHLCWLCVLNPGTSTWQTVQSLLSEAYATAVRKQAKREHA